MAIQRLGDKKLAKIRRETGIDYVSAWNRGGWHPWWQCDLQQSPEGFLNADMVNYETWEVRPVWRDGKPVAIEASQQMVAKAARLGRMQAFVNTVIQEAYPDA
jgi:hypothetical protein